MSLNFAVIGNPVKHSLSPQIHQLFAKQFNLVINYQAIEVAILDFEKTVRDFFKEESNIGLNITIPFKLRAFIIADNCDELAQISGSANTLHSNQHKIEAFNTDGLGLLADFRHNQIEIKAKKILIIGAGGAARGILMPLVSKKPKQITIANRSRQNAENLCNEFNSHPSLKPNFNFDFCSFNELKEQTQDKFDVIINATSLSLLNDVPAIDCHIYQDSICYDLVYQLNSDTAFNRISKRYGALKSLNGLGMLVEQAAHSFEIWHGKMPETREVLSHLTATINK